MLQELATNQFERARPLFQGFDYGLSIQAAIDGNNPGRIFFDNLDQPRTAFALTVEGYLLAGEHAKTTRYYEQVFEQRDENPDYYYHLTASAWALLQNQEKAHHCLTAAADHGWTNAEWTRQQEEFSILHGMPEWDALLSRM